MSDGLSIQNYSPRSTVDWSYSKNYFRNSRGPPGESGGVGGGWLLLGCGRFHRDSAFPSHPGNCRFQGVNKSILANAFIANNPPRFGNAPNNPVPLDAARANRHCNKSLADVFDFAFGASHLHSPLFSSVATCFRWVKYTYLFGVVNRYRGGKPGIFGNIFSRVGGLPGVRFSRMPERFGGASPNPALA